MWPRVLEIMVACWLAASPFVFHHPADRLDLWITDVGSALAVATLALATWLPRFRRAHLLALLVAGWLVGFGWIGSRAEPLVAYENQIVVGLLLLMVAIVPTEASKPPILWRRFYCG